MSHPVAFEPAVAATLNHIPAAMEASHDLLVRRWGQRRISGIAWSIYGPPLAIEMARLRGVGPETATTQGTIEDGFTTLEQMINDSAQMDDTTRDKLDELHSFALTSENPTLIIAYCTVGDPHHHNNHPYENGHRQ